MRDGEPLISVIVPARNAAANLPEQLSSLVRQTYPEPFEVIVVDNGSTDGTAEAARRFMTLLDLKVIAADERLGPAYTRNVGSRHARGHLLCFCDADDVVGETWLTELAKVAEASDAVSGRLDEVSLNTREVQSWRNRLAPDGLPNGWYFLDYAVSCNFAIWKSVFERLGGFREDFVSCEDIDLSWRLQLAGGRLSFAADAVVAYRHRATHLGLARQSFVRGKWTVALLSVYKNVPTVEGRRPRLGTLWERLSYWEPIGSRDDSIGRWICATAFELGLLAGWLSSIPTVFQRIARGRATPVFAAECSNNRAHPAGGGEDAKS